MSSIFADTLVYIFVILYCYCKSETLRTSGKATAALLIIPAIIFIYKSVD